MKRYSFFFLCPTRRNYVSVFPFERVFFYYFSIVTRSIAERGSTLHGT